MKTALAVTLTAATTVWLVALMVWFEPTTGTATVTLVLACAAAWAWRCR